MTKTEIEAFQSVVTEYYQQYGRHDLPWRQTVNGLFDPYRIMVSELMLQQTSVTRVF